MNQTLKQKGITLQDECMTTIESLIHIASMSGSRGAMDVVDDMDFGDFHSIIPSVTKEEYDGYDDKVEILTDYDRWGFIAECAFNVPQKFSFREDGSFQSCSNSSMYYPFYMYADSMEELLDKIIKKDKKMFEKEENKARKELGIVMQ